MSRRGFDDSLERAARASPRIACALTDPEVRRLVEDYDAYSTCVVGRGCPVVDPGDALEWLVGGDERVVGWTLDATRRGAEFRERRDALLGRLFEAPPEGGDPCWESDPRLFGVMHWHRYQIRREGDLFHLYRCDLGDPYLATYRSYEEASAGAARDSRGEAARRRCGM